MTNYQKIGSGKALIFLHGWGDSSKTFAPLIESLKDDYETLALDLPGFGGTQAPPEAWGIDDYAAFVEAWLAKIGIKNTDAIIAHSNGGAIAIKAISTGKIKTDKLVLMASAGIRDKQKTRKKILKAGAKGGKAMTFFLPGGTKEKIRNRFYKSIGSDAILFSQLEETFRRVVGEDVQPAAEKIAIPTLLIYGDKDKDTPVSYGRIFNRHMRGSQLEIIESGHFVHQEQPANVAKLVSDFLKAKDA